MESNALLSYAPQGLTESEAAIFVPHSGTKIRHYFRPQKSPHFVCGLKSASA